MFWGFAVRLAVGAVLTPFLLALILAPFLALTALILKVERRWLWALSYVPTYLLTVGAQVYFWGAWAAYCAALAVSRAASPTVTDGWSYYVTAFISLGGPLGYLSSKEKAMAESSTEVSWILRI